MMNRKRRAGSTAAGLVAVATAAMVVIGLRHASGMRVARPATPSSQGRTWPGHIPLVVLNRNGGMIRHGYQRGSIEVGSARKSITLRWAAGSIANLHPDEMPPAAPLQDSLGWLEEAAQPFQVRYHPLNATVLDARRVLVAGVDDAGNTVLEVWHLGWPAQMPAPPTASGGGGPSALSVVLPQRSVQRILTAAHPGRTHVLNACPIRRLDGEPTHALVQYLESSALHVVDLLTGDHSLLAAEGEGGALGAVPALGLRHYNTLSDFQHGSAGFVYILRRFLPRSGPENDGDVVVFLDADSDGVIDAHQVVSATQFAAPGGFGDLSNYPTWWE